LIRVRCSGLLPELLSAYINSAYGREWVASVVNQQVGQANVNGTKLRQLGIPVMHREEQGEIVRRVDAAFAWIDRLASEATNARKLIDHLDRAVLAKAFHGELVPRDPNEEPASALLERIRAERAKGSDKPSKRTRPGN
jgi:type I restriction enzyme S subunit